MASIDYAALAAKHISRPAETVRYPTYHIYARNKKGKTRFSLSAGIDATLVLDPEDGTDEMKKLNPHVWKIERWSDIDDAYNFLRHGKHEFKWVSVDGLTRFNNMALKHVMKMQEDKSLDRIPGIVQQRDYGKSGELMKDMLTRFHTLKMGVIFTSQERMGDSYASEEDEEVPSDDDDATFIPNLPVGVRGYVNSIADVIGRLYTVKDENNKVVRRLWIGDSLKYDTGYRSDFELPPYLTTPTIPRLTRLIRTGSPAAKAATPAKA